MVIMIAGDNEVTGEFTLVGGEHSGVPVDAIVKVKFQQVKSGQYASPLDPYELEITLTQKLDMGLAELAEAVNIGDELMKGNQLVCCCAICYCNILML